MRLEVTRKSDLAVQVLRALAVCEGRAKASELATAVGTTPAFVAQVVSPLVSRGWVRSEPGPTGGYRLAAELEDVSVLAVIEAVEGPTDTGRCVLADRPCHEVVPCALHVPWSQARDRLLRALERVSIADLTDVDSAEPVSRVSP